MIHRTEDINLLVEHSSLFDAALPLQSLDRICLTLIGVINHANGGKRPFADLFVLRLSVRSSHCSSGKWCGNILAPRVLGDAFWIRCRFSADACRQLRAAVEVTATTAIKPLTTRRSKGDRLHTGGASVTFVTFLKLIQFWSPPREAYSQSRCLAAASVVAYPAKVLICSTMTQALLPTANELDHLPEHVAPSIAKNAL